MSRLNGQDVTQINVVNDKICVYDDNGNFYYLKSSELLKMINEFNFNISQPKKYKYLEVELGNQYQCNNCGGGFSHDEMDFGSDDGEDVCKNCSYRSFNDAPYGE